MIGVNYFHVTILRFHIESGFERKHFRIHIHLYCSYIIYNVSEIKESRLKLVYFSFFTFGI